MVTQEPGSEGKLLSPDLEDLKHRFFNQLFWREPFDGVDHLIVPDYQAADVIAAAQSRLVGWDQSFNRNSLRPISLQILNTIDPLSLATKPCDGEFTNRLLSSDGAVSTLTINQHGYLLPPVFRYRYDDDGNLMRSKACVSGANEEIQVRSIGSKAKIALEDALVAIAALLHAFEPYRGRINKAHVLSTATGKEITKPGWALLRAIEDNRMGLVGTGCDVVEPVLRKFLENVGERTKSSRFAGVPARPRLMLMMKPLQFCFQHLYDERATTKYVPQLDDETGTCQAGGQFVDFASAFLDLVGWSCRRNTIHDALCDSRKASS